MELDLKVDKVKAFQDFILEERNKCGGVIISIIIPPNLKDVMFNVKQEAESNEDFYLYGWYNQFRFQIYVDNTLTDNFYVIGNYKTLKFKVLNG